MSHLLTNREAAQVISSKESQSDLAFVYGLDYEVKQGRRWMKVSMLFLSSDSRNAEADFVETLHGAAIRNLTKQAKVLRA